MPKKFNPWLVGIALVGILAALATIGAAPAGAGAASSVQIETR